jgi:hypothetical protein
MTSTLLEAFREGRVRIPDDEELRRELLGLIIKESSAGFRFENAPGHFDDRVVALTLALILAERKRRRTLSNVSAKALASAFASGRTGSPWSGADSSGGRPAIGREAEQVGSTLDSGWHRRGE